LADADGNLRRHLCPLPANSGRRLLHFIFCEQSSTCTCLCAPRLGRWISSRRPDSQDKSGSATGLTIPRGLRSREAVKVRRRETIRVAAGFEWSSRVGNFRENAARLTACGAGDKVASRGKRVLNFLFSIDAFFLSPPVGAFGAIDWKTYVWLL
jgi:hypothetical protein